jgi:hypothetical protein
MTQRTLSAVSAAVAMTILTACSDSTSPDPASAFDAQVSADIAPSAGEEIASETDFYAAASASGTSGVAFTQLVGPGVSAAIAPPTSAAAMWINPSCAVSSSLVYTCPPLTRRGHTLSVSYEFRDQLGVLQSAYDATTTASIAFTVNDTGATLYTWNQNSYADTSGRHRQATVSNLVGHPDTLHIWNGTGSTTMRSVRSGQITKAYSLSSNDTTTNVKIRQPRTLNPYPLSGTIIRNYSVTRTRMASDTVTRSATRRVVVTFNGTASVPMQVGTESYLLNLDTRRVRKP